MYRIEDEETGETCGFDYTSFFDGYDCDNLATKVIIEGEDFHWAHLCEGHARKVWETLIESPVVYPLNNPNASWNLPK